MSGFAGPSQFTQPLTGNPVQDRPVIQAAADYVIDPSNSTDDRLWVLLHFFCDRIRGAYKF